MALDVELEKDAATVAVELAVMSAASSPLSEMEGKLDDAAFYATTDRSKLVIKFSNVSARKEAQALLCSERVLGNWRGTKFKHTGKDMSINAQKPLFQGRRDKKLFHAQSSFMKQDGSTDWKDDVINWELRNITYKPTGTVLAKQQQEGLWFIE